MSGRGRTLGNMRSLDHICYVDGCDSTRRPDRVMCGGHWHRLTFGRRKELGRASLRLERREQAIDRYGWTLERQDEVDEAGARLLDLQTDAVMAIERLEGVLAAT